MQSTPFTCPAYLEQPQLYASYLASNPVSSDPGDSIVVAADVGQQSSSSSRPLGLILGLTLGLSAAGLLLAVIVWQVMKHRAAKLAYAPAQRDSINV